MPKDTIFSPSFGNRPTHLLGRQAILQDFSNALTMETGNRERSLVLLGQRGTGKTVLLWELADLARSQGYVVANPTTVSDGMLERIVEKIQDDGERFTKNRQARLSGANIGALGFAAGLQFTREIEETKSFQFKLTQICRALTAQGHGVLILIDELQANSPDIRQIVVAYQELIGERLNIALVMAGLPGAVSATLNDKVLTFLNRARKIPVGPISIGEIDAFYTQAFQEMGIEVTPELRRKAAQVTEGSPYMMQLVGHYCTLYARPGKKIDSEVLSQALQTAKEDFMNDVCNTTMASLSEKDAEFLHVMSQFDDPVKISDVATRWEVSYDYAQKYRKRLIDAGVIQAAGRGEIRFAVPYLRDFLLE